MKKSAPYLILFILALLIGNALFDGHGMAIDIDGEDFDGPLGGIAAVLFASGGILIGIVVAALVAVILAVLFAGVGIVVVCALVLAAIVVALAVSPLLLPLMIPVAIIWLVTRRKSARPVDAKAQPA